MEAKADKRYLIQTKLSLIADLRQQISKENGSDSTFSTSDVIKHSYQRPQNVSDTTDKSQRNYQFHCHNHFLN
jgi:hypothetical protein